MSLPEVLESPVHRCHLSALEDLEDLHLLVHREDRSVPVYTTRTFTEHQPRVGL